MSTSSDQCQQADTKPGFHICETFEDEIGDFSPHFSYEQMLYNLNVMDLIRITSLS